MFSGDVVRLLVLLAVFVSIFMLAQSVLSVSAAGRAHSSAINKRLKMISVGADRAEIVGQLRKHDPLELQQLGFLAAPAVKLKRLLMMAAVPIGLMPVLLAMAAVFAVAVLVASMIVVSSGLSFTFGVIQMIFAFSAALAFGLPLVVFNIMAQRRRKKMQEQFPVALDIFVRALRSGHPVSSAIDLLTTEMEDPIGSEFGLVSDEVAYGMSLNDALEDMAERWDLEDIRMFVTSLSVQNETGGNLAEVLDNLSTVIRSRAALYLKVRALSSEGRMTGWLLTALPIIAFVSLFMINPEFYLSVAEEPAFFIGFPLLIGWYFVGVFMIRKMINIRV